MKLCIWMFLGIVLVGFASANIITNPGFSSTASWNFYTNGVGSFTASGTANIDIVTKGSNTQLFQNNIQLNPNTEYKLSFTAKSDKASDMQLKLFKHTSPYTDYGLGTWDIPLTNTWNNYEKTFTTTSTATTDARIMFWLIDGTATEKYEIDNILLEETSTPINNIVSNSGFDSISSWNFYTNGVGSFSAAGTANIDIVTKGSNTQLFQNNIQLNPNTEYKLSFTAKSDKASDMQLKLFKHTSPYTDYGLGTWDIPLTNTWNNYEKTFTTTSTATTDARIMFWLVQGVNGEKYWIDNVTLDATGTPPPVGLTVSVYNTPSNPVNGDTVSVIATSNSAAIIRLYVDDVLVNTCNAATTCTYAEAYTTGTYTYYATAQAATTVRDPASGTKSFTVTTTPPPSGGGKVFREYYATMSENTLKDWRVTDPTSPYVGDPANSPSTYLPNAKININVNDLSQATGAEAIIDYWGGHVGTIGQKMKFNNNAWITIPKMTSTNGIPAGHNAECYTQTQNVQTSVPLGNLIVGTNVFEGTSGGQTCYNFNWGQWGWYGMVLRVYYNENKPHPTGSITSPSNNGVIGENPTINVVASSPSGIAKVEVIAYYDGPDYDGDGIYKEWQESYRKVKGQNVITHQYIVGSDTSAPYSFVWDTSMVPDQAANSIKLKARILDNNGVWYETAETTGLTLQRSGSVKLYKAVTVPEKFWVRAGETKSSTFNIPSNNNLAQATSAKLLIHTWNGIDGAAEPGQTHYTKVNAWTAPNYGQNHYYSFNALTLPTSALHSGTNTVTVNSQSIHHGIEITWPGPSMIVRFSTAQP